jgi:hypothetical protein
MPPTIKFDSKKFNPAFRPYMQATQRVQLFMGNRGSGKSIFNYQRAIVYALTKKYFRLVYCRKIADTIRKSIFQGFKDIIAEWDMQQYFSIKETDMQITCLLNGNQLIAFGLDNPEKLKGIKDPTHVLWDEMTEGTFADYGQLQAILRTQKAPTQFWGMFNPEHNFWGRETFFAESDKDEIPLGVVPAKTADTLIFKATFKDNPFINVEEYEAKLIELARGDENYLTVWIEGNWGSSQTGNEYMTKFNKAVHVMQVPFLPGKAVHLSYDFNALPYMTQLCGQVDVRDGYLQIRIFKEYCLPSPNNSTVAVGQAFLADFKERLTDLFYYGDASGNNRIAGKGNSTAFDDVVKVFTNYLSQASRRVLRSNPSVLKRRDFMNDLFDGRIYLNGMQVTIVIDENCKELIKDLRLLKLGIDGKLKKRVTDKASGLSWEELGHTSDALEYFVVRLFWDVFNAKP